MISSHRASEPRPIARWGAVASAFPLGPIHSRIPSLYRRAWFALAGLALLLSACGSGSPPDPVAPATPAAVEAARVTPTPAGETDGASMAPTVTREESDAVQGAPPTPIAAKDASAEPIDPTTVALALQPVARGLDRPLFVTHAGDGSGRLFVVEKGGSLRILRDGVLLPEPYLDIRDRVNSSGNEQGLLGLAFAPDFPTSGALFVNYTDAKGATTVSRFQTPDPAADRIDAATEVPILVIGQPARNHNGGMLAFGPDGYLYIGTGDGGAANDRFANGQNPQTLLGKMLRLDVTSDPAAGYTIPADNPWIQQDWNGADVRDEIWAVGLRNPWRYSFDRQTGDLWIGDVGQNQYEEINRTPAGHPGGLNYGWPILEGLHCFQSPGNCDAAGLELPVAEYSHSEGGCSVTGGYVYRGGRYPVLNGVYLFGDYCTGNLWATWPAGPDEWQTGLLLRSGIQISSFGEGGDGELYVTDLSGTVYQIQLP